MAMTSPAGMTMVGVSQVAASRMASLSSLVCAFTSYCSCREGAPLLTMSRIAPISSLLLFKVRLEATLDCTRGEVTRTYVICFKKWYVMHSLVLLGVLTRPEEDLQTRVSPGATFSNQKTECTGCQFRVAV